MIRLKTHINNKDICQGLNIFYYKETEKVDSYYLGMIRLQNIVNYKNSWFAVIIEYKCELEI